MVRATLGGQVNLQGISRGYVMRGAGVYDASLILEKIRSGMLTASCQEILGEADGFYRPYLTGFTYRRPNRSRAKKRTRESVVFVFSATGCEARELESLAGS